MTDFRVLYFREAQKCLKLLDRQEVDSPEFWANLLGTIANGVLASVPDSVAVAFLESEERRKAHHRAVRDHIEAKLK